MKKQYIVVAALMIISGAAGWFLSSINWSTGTPEINDKVLAVINDSVITEDDFLTQMKLRGGKNAGQYHDIKQKQVLLEYLINQKLLMSKALQSGTDQDPLVQKIYQQTVIDKFLEAGLNDELTKINVTTAEVERYFEEHKNSYNRPARRRGAIIFKKTSDDMTNANKQALKDELLAVKQAAIQLPSHQTHFGELARIHSDDRASMFQGGVIGWLIESPNRAYKWPQAVTDTLFSLSENGALSDIVETDKGYYLVRLVGAENTKETEFKLIASGIKQKILSDKQAAAKKAFLAEIQANAHIEINEALLQSINPINPEPKDDSNQPPAMPVQAGVKP